MKTHIVNVGFHADHIIKPIMTYGANKVILINYLDENSKFKDEVLFAIEKAEELCTISGLECKKLDLEWESFEKTVELISKKIKTEDEVVLNITGGKKTISIAMIYAAFLNPEKISRIVYDEEKEIKEIPMPNTWSRLLSDFKSGKTLTGMEQRILGVIYEKNMSISEIAAELRITSPAVLKSVNDLELKGYVESIKEGKSRIIKLIK